MNQALIQFIQEKVPAPFCYDNYEIFKKGIYDDDNINVYINHEKSFCFLFPQKEIDYVHYQPRVNKLNLNSYYKKVAVYERRFNKVKKYFSPEIKSLIEIGAGNGSFLKLVKNELKIDLTAIEPDLLTLDDRMKIIDKNYIDIEDVIKLNRHYDFVCFFHVLEHVLNPAEFLNKVKSILHKNSLLIVEVPSLDDPLISLYNNISYQKFFFQIQHPFIYSSRSLKRLMEENGFLTKELIPFQRYGFENHVNWLIKGKPGGNEEIDSVFKLNQYTYTKDIELTKKTDSIIWVGKI